MFVQRTHSFNLSLWFKVYLYLSFAGLHRVGDIYYEKKNCCFGEKQIFKLYKISHICLLINSFGDFLGKRNMAFFSEALYVLVCSRYVTVAGKQLEFSVNLHLKKSL